MAQKQIKSKKRVADRGEVFTARREVVAMCDLVKTQTERIDSRFLEPACGEGNFLMEILARKLEVVTSRYKKSFYDWERYSLLALGSMYGVEIMADNCEICRNNLFNIWQKKYNSVCKKECNKDTEAAARFILSKNIVCGNALSYHLVDENGKDTEKPIVFIEWSFPRNDSFIYCKMYIFEELINGKAKKEKNSGQIGLLDSEEKDENATLIDEYKCHYRRLGINE